MVPSFPPFRTPPLPWQYSTKIKLGARLIKELFRWCCPVKLLNVSIGAGHDIGHGGYQWQFPTPPPSTQLYLRAVKLKHVSTPWQSLHSLLHYMKSNIRHCTCVLCWIFFIANKHYFQYISNFYFQALFPSTISNKSTISNIYILYVYP